MEEYEDEVICDLAETYHIFNYEEIKGRRLATLVCGLRPSSRVMSKMSGLTTSVNECLQAMSVDALNTLVWMQTKDAEKGRNRPSSIASTFFEKKESQGFSSADDYEAERERILRSNKNG